VLVAQRIEPEAHTLLFVLSVLAIVPLAALLSHATAAVTVKTGDTVGGLLNATLGNLTELVIALTALRPTASGIRAGAAAVLNEIVVENEPATRPWGSKFPMFVPLSV